MTMLRMLVRVERVGAPGVRAVVGIDVDADGMTAAVTAALSNVPAIVAELAAIAAGDALDVDRRRNA